MLALNSYGLHSGAASPPRSNNNSSNGFVTLPRISGGGFPAARSLGKVELMAARRGEHPLYRTTTGFDYGRYLDIDGGNGALSCPKHAKIAGFTREFIAGSYCDSSLQSIDKGKLRAEAWQRKVAERTKRMQLKHEELQQQLELRQEERRRERDVRRRELRRREDAARVIQMAARRYIEWRERRSENRRRDSLAAIAIQQAFRSRSEVWRAKRELQSLRFGQLEGFALKLQRATRNFLLKISAKRELAHRRETKLVADEARRIAEEMARQSAANEIQRAMRGFVARRKLQPQFSSASSIGDGSGGSGRGHDHLDGSSSGRSGSRGRNIARRTLVAALQPGGGGTSRRRREKSVSRFQLK